MNESPNKAAALALANRGLRIFPCNADKTPTVSAWEGAATNSLFAVSVKWDAAGGALPAIPVGAHGFVVIDADLKPGRPDGVAAFQGLCANLGIDLSRAFTVATPSGGRHYYFATSTPYGNSPGSLPDGIDVRGVGGYVIGPGATLPDGRSYRIIAGSWDAIPPLPDALSRFLREKRAVGAATIEARSDGSPASDRERRFAVAARNFEVARLRAMGEGSGRNRALNEAAHSLGTMDGWIDLSEVANALYQASLDNGYVAKDGASAAQQTIMSGIEAGRKKPRKLLTEWTDDELDEDEPWIHAMIEAAKRKQPAPLSEKGKRSTQESTQEAPKSKRSVTLLQMSNIEARPVTWLWDQYVALGKLTILAGAGGTGKSTIAFNLVGTITTGGLWADGTRYNGAGNVLIWSSEDDPADTIKPRLMAVGANEQRCGIISGTVDEHGVPNSFDPSRDMAGLREAVNGIGGISLLIIDPIVTAVSGDMHKANDVRRGLQPIVDFAAECNCAVIGITHFAKGTAGRNSGDRVIGSQAFRDMSRMTLVAAKEEASDRRVFAREKSNNSPDTGGFSYRIEALTLSQGIVATRVVWGEALNGSARSILDDVEGEMSTEDTSKMGQAKAFLMESLTNQAVGSKELFKNAYERFSISEKTLRRAGEKLGIKPQKHPSYQGGWYWSLPQSAS